jgi:hypothetical protein
MLARFTVFDVQSDTYEGKKGSVNQTVYTLQDASEGAKLKQYVEFPQADDAPKMKIGEVIDVEITEIPMIFSGRPRIRGKVRQHRAPVK